MAAHNEKFPWLSYYGNYQFFEQRMREHRRVRDLETLEPGLYRILRDDETVLQTFICECYSYGVAEYTETVDKLGHLNAVIINSNWCKYSDELKIICRHGSIGLFDIRDFMAALNRNDYWNYLGEWEERRLRERGLL